MYFEETFVINDKLTITQPSILDIAKFGENRYFNMVYTICSIPSNYKSELWDMGYDYSKVDEFEFFILLTRNIGAEDTKLLLGNVSFKDMIPVMDKVTEALVLIDENTGLIIDKDIYTKMIEHIRNMHNIRVKRERPANKITREILIDEDRTKKAFRKKEPSDDGSILFPLVSAMVNSPGFKYDIEGVKKLGIYPFMDSVQRIEAITSANAILNGLYGGWVDLSKNPNLQKQLNWLRDLSKDNHRNSNVTVNGK